MVVAAILKVLIGFGLLGIILYWGVPLFEASQIYFPTREWDGTPQNLGFAYEEVSFPAEDGVLLSGWWVPLEKARGTVILFHGNAGNISHRLHHLELYRRLGLQALLFDYRGYGRNGGRPSEKGLYRDAVGALRYLERRGDVPMDRIVYCGESLGAAVAVELALNRPPSLLILEGAFTSVPAMAGRIYPWLPIGPLLRTRFDNLAKVPRVSCPTLLIHSRQDELVPFSFGEHLWKASGARVKKLYPISGGHNEAFLLHADEIAAQWERFLSEAGLS